MHWSNHYQLNQNKIQLTDIMLSSLKYAAKSRTPVTKSLQKSILNNHENNHQIPSNIECQNNIRENSFLLITYYESADLIKSKLFFFLTPIIILIGNAGCEK